MRRRAVVAGIALALAAAPAAAQVDIAPAPVESGWTKTRVAKWALLAAAVGFGTYALVETGRASDYYGELRAHCQSDPEACRLNDGRYVDAYAESLFDEATAADRRARVGIIGGQVTLLGSAALFVYDLRNGRGGPSDIPYPRPGARFGVGLQMTF